MPQHTLVLGGGGVTGIAWITGMLAGLADAGIDVVHPASILGTSAGSAVAAQVASGIPIAELFERQLAGVNFEIAKSSRAMLLPFMAAQLFSRSAENAGRKIGEKAIAAKVGPVEERRGVIEARLRVTDWPAADLRIVAVDALTGVARVITKADGFDLIDTVAASCAVPMVWPTVTLDGRQYTDGGTRSPVNLDLAPGSGPVIAIAPTAASIRKWSSLATQRAALGGRPVEIVTPSDAAKKAQGRDSLDTSTVPAAAKAGFEQAAEEVARLSPLVYL